jgi:hypothetical protein
MVKVSLMKGKEYTEQFDKQGDQSEMVVQNSLERKTTSLKTGELKKQKSTPLKTAVLKSNRFKRWKARVSQLLRIKVRKARYLLELLASMILESIQETS